jgi:hypothetical protein
MRALLITIIWASLGSRIPPSPKPDSPLAWRASADVAEPVRQALMSYLKGPKLEVIALEARIPQQIAAEAGEKGCTFVQYTRAFRNPK